MDPTADSAAAPKKRRRPRKFHIEAERKAAKSEYDQRYYQSKTKERKKTARENRTHAAPNTGPSGMSSMSIPQKLLRPNSSTSTESTRHTYRRDVHRSL